MELFAAFVVTAISSTIIFHLTRTALEKLLFGGDALEDQFEACNEFGEDAN